MDKHTTAPALSAPILLTSMTHESAADFVLPEYMPPIRRVISVEAVPLPESRFLSGTAMELGGTLAFAVLYIGEDGAVSCASVTSEYTASCALGEIQIAEESGKLIWKCPKCGNDDQNKMNVARRTCGYIGTQFWNQGRTQEIRDRVLHL